MIKLLSKVFNLIKYQKVNHQKVFTEIYDNSIWGKANDVKFYSGSGSEDEYGKPYAEVINNFIHLNNIISIVDGYYSSRQMVTDNK